MFDHPEADNWMDQQVGDTVALSGANGTATYIVTNVEDTGPENASSFYSTEEELTCELKRTFTLKSEGVSGALIIELQQNERQEVESSEEGLDIQIESRFDDRSVLVALMFAIPFERNGVAPFTESIYRPVATFAGRVFQDVVSSTAFPGSFGYYQAGEVQTVSIAFSRGEGLIALERSDVGLLVLTSP